MLKRLKTEKLRLLAPMLGVSFDTLKQRHRERFIKSVITISVTVALFFSIFGGFALYQADQVNRANQALLVQIAETNRQKNIADLNAEEARMQRDTALISQSKNLASLSDQQLKTGNTITAALLALEALPDDLSNPGRPLVPEAQAALRNAALFDAYGSYRPMTVIDCPTFYGIGITSFGVSPDGKLLAVANEYSGSTTVYDIASCKQLYSLPGIVSNFKYNDKDKYQERLSSGASTIQFSDDSSKIYLPIKNGIPYVIDSLTGKTVMSLEKDGSAMSNLFDIPEYDIQYSEYDLTNHCTHYYFIKDRSTRFELTSYSSGTVIFSRGDRYVFFSGSQFQGPIIEEVYDTYSGNLLFRLPTRDYANWIDEGNTSFSPDGKYLVTYHYDNTDSSKSIISVFEVSSGLKLFEYEYDPSRIAHKTGAYWSAIDVTPPAFSPDNRFVALPRNDYKVGIYELTSGKLTCELSGHKDAVNCVNFDKSGRYLVTASSDGKVIVWGLPDGNAVETIPLPSGYQGMKADFAGENNIVVLRYNETDETESIQIMQKRENDYVARLSSSLDEKKTCFYPDGKRIIIVNSVYDTSIGSRLFDLGESKYADCFDFSSDGKEIAGDTLSDILIWEADTGKVLRKMKPSSIIGSCNSVAFSSDGKRIAAWTQFPDIDGGGFRVFDAQSGEEILKSLVGPTGNEAYDRDLNLMLYNYKNTAQVFNLKTGKLLYKLDREVQSSALSGSGEFLAVSDIETTELLILDASTGKQLLTLDTGGKLIRNLCFSPDSKTLFACSIVGQMRLFSSSDGSVIFSVYDQKSGSQPTYFSEDGRFLANGSIVLDSVTGDVILSFSEPVKISRFFKAISPNGKAIAVSEIPDYTTGLENQTKVYKIPDIDELLKNKDSLTFGHTLNTDERKKYNIE